jgi:hypothetical protein
VIPLLFIYLFLPVMTIKAFFLSLLTSSSISKSRPDYKTVDGCCVPYAEGQAALRNGQAVLVGGLLVGSVKVTNSVRLVGRDDRLG